MLSEEEERGIVRSCQLLAQSGFGVDRIIVGRVVRDYLKSQGPFQRWSPWEEVVVGVSQPVAITLRKETTAFPNKQG